MNFKVNGSKVICLVVFVICFSFLASSSNIAWAMDKVNNSEIVFDSDFFTKIKCDATITFPSLDGLDITADLYLIDKTSPIILMFHRAGWSRGEYLEIAPKLNALGYNVMAIDARSGSGINGVENETTRRALDKELGVTYPDAAVDIEAAIQYAKNKLGYNNIITWGSSYSASLVIAKSQKHSDTVRGVIGFAPGEYFKLDRKSIAKHAKELTLPVFITGAKAEEKWYRPIYNAIPDENKVIFVPKYEGIHGSQALWQSYRYNYEYWNAVKSFLNDVKKDIKNEKELPGKETIVFPSLDGLNITGDLYLIDDHSPIILMFHRARWSRGEYLEIAPRLNELGYNVMAIDARSGANINGVENETVKQAIQYGLGITYPDAAVDIEATIKYAKNELGYNKIITWGSSYSASLVIALSQKYSDNVKAVLAFAPGEYFKLEEKSITQLATELRLPVFITGAKAEEDWYRPIFEAIPSENKVIYVPDHDGYHGSQALWKSSRENQTYWKAVTSFLESLEIK